MNKAYLVVQAYLRLWSRHTALQISSLIALTMGFCAVFTVTTFNHNLIKMLTVWGDTQQVSVYLTENISEAEKKNLEDVLTKDSRIEQVAYVPQAEALSRFQEQMSSYAPDLVNEQELLSAIPASFSFSLSNQISLSEHLSILKSLAEALVTQPGVEDVSYGQDWVQTYAQAVQSVQGLGWGLIGLVSVFAAFVICNALQSSIRERQEEIEVLELIGATPRFIRTPFLLSSLFNVTLAFILSWALSKGVFESLQQFLRSKESFVQVSAQMSFLPYLQITAIFVTGILLTGLTSYFYLLRFNSGWAASRRILYK